MIHKLIQIDRQRVIDILKHNDTELQIYAFGKIQTYVMVTILVLLLQLGYLLKPYAYGFFRLLSWVSYLLVPVLISYILGLMGQPLPGLGMANEDMWVTQRHLTCIWAIFLLFAYAGFDNLNAFSVDEISGRSKQVFQFLIQLILLLIIIMENLPSDVNKIPMLCAFFVVFLKFIERLFALGHAAGATPTIKRDVRRSINYMQAEEEHELQPHPPFSNYLVGPRYSTVKDKKIIDGITMKKIWGCQGKLLTQGDPDGKLKDTCLSFSLFWVLLGKFVGFPLYQPNTTSNKKAWKLFREGLLKGIEGHEGLLKGIEGHAERVFRVIEVELAFLREYFHTKFFFFYFNGFYWKLSALSFPLLFWWFTRKEIDFEKLNEAYQREGYNASAASLATKIVISVILALEAAQLVIFLASRWLKVTLLCYYVKKKTASNSSCYFLEKIGSIFLGGNGTNTWWRKPWKRELQQYSLLHSCSHLSKGTTFLQSVAAALGVPFPKPGRKQEVNIELSQQVKEAVVVSLQRNGPKLSNGAAALSFNGVDRELSWACKLNKDAEVILVWHIATSVCEMHPDSRNDEMRSSNDFKVATSLSKYCAFLLGFSSSLLPVPAHEAESICDTAIEEARNLFKKCVFPCGKTPDRSDRMMKLISDMEKGNLEGSVLQRGVKLGHDLVSVVEDKGRRWKILAELWAEMILFLAPSNSNEMEHAEKLAQGGEFITHLWALLIHAGITDRDAMAAFQEDE